MTSSFREVTFEQLMEENNRLAANAAKYSSDTGRKFVKSDTINPPHPVFRCVFDEDKLEVLTSDVYPSTVKRVDREEYPAIYLGDFMDENGCMPKKIDGIEGAWMVINTVNATIAAHREKLIKLSSWALELALAELLKPYGFWSTCVHPLEAIQPIVRTKTGSNTRRLRKTRKTTSPQVKRAIDAESKKPLENLVHRKTSKPKQSEPDKLSKLLETCDTTDGVDHEDPNRQKTLEYAADIIYRWLNATKDEASEASKVALTGDALIVGNMSANLGREMCRWIQDRWNLRATQLGIQDLDGNYPIVIPKCLAKVKKSIVDKFQRSVKSGKVTPYKKPKNFNLDS